WPGWPGQTPPGRPSGRRRLSLEFLAKGVPPKTKHSPGENCAATSVSITPASDKRMRANGQKYL
ncbi:MAG: hypothetical protein ACE14V_10950, partial [bacterium]